MIYGFLKLKNKKNTTLTVILPDVGS